MVPLFTASGAIHHVHVMATSTALSVVNVVNAPQDLTMEETKGLALQLGVKLPVLVDLELQYMHRKNSFKPHSIQSWLDNDVEANWEKIIAGLKRIGKNVLAESMASQFCPAKVPVANSPSSDPSSLATAHTVQPVHPPPEAAMLGVAQSPVTTESAVTGPLPPAISPPSVLPHPPDEDRVVEVKERVDHLETKFLSVVTQFRRAMTKNEARDKEFLEDFRDALSLLPVAKRISHARFFQERESEIIAAKTVRILITILNRYWNYNNYDLLQYLISEFSEEPLKGDMKQYCEVLEKYEIKTTVDIFLQAFSANSELSVAFSGIVVKINTPPSECTLHDIRKFREALAVQSSICSYCIYVDNVTASSVRVALGFHPSALGWVLAALSPSFLESHQLSNVVVEGEPLVVCQTRYLVCLTFTLYNMRIVYGVIFVCKH